MNTDFKNEGQDGKMGPVREWVLVGGRRMNEGIKAGEYG
jgi:hypothetical protein